MSVYCVSTLLLRLLLCVRVYFEPPDSPSLSRPPFRGLPSKGPKPLSLAALGQRGVAPQPDPLPQQPLIEARFLWAAPPPLATSVCVGVGWWLRPLSLRFPGPRDGFAAPVDAPGTFQARNPSEIGPKESPAPSWGFCWGRGCFTIRWPLIDTYSSSGTAVSCPDSSPKRWPLSPSHRCGHQGSQR